MNEPSKAVRIVSEDGFVDVSLPMLALTRNSDGTCNIEAGGQHGDRRVGFGIQLSNTWDRQDLENNALNALYWGRVVLVSIGGESDRFLHLLDELYGTGLKPSTMRERIPFLAVSLQGNPSNSEQSSIKLKLFFESDCEERDADFFLNLDTQARTVEFREKDTDYRRGVILALARIVLVT